MTTDVCRKFIEHIHKVVPIVVMLERRATADIPNKLCSEQSMGKSIEHFSKKSMLPDMITKLDVLLGR